MLQQTVAKQKQTWLFVSCRSPFGQVGSLANDEDARGNRLSIVGNATVIKTMSWHDYKVDSPPPDILQDALFQFLGTVPSPNFVR